MTNNISDIIKDIKDYFENEIVRKNDATKAFSEDVINLALQKLSANVTDMIQSEEDPVVIAEIVKNYLTITKMIDERDLPRQQMLIKLFEQLNKYEQSRYY